MLGNMVGIVGMVVKQVRTKDNREMQVDLKMGDMVGQLLTKTHQQQIDYFLKLSQSLEASVA